MDTETVLKIIAMLDNRINNIYYGVMPELADNPDTLPWQYEKCAGAVSELMDFRDHLQSYIESQVNQVENEINKGE
jgi:RNA processing factor Prp31